MHEVFLLQYAKNELGEPVFVDEVPKGQACNCTCPKCGEKLIARQGKHNTHSFAHVSGKICKYAYETSLHLLAKKILSEKRGLIKIPALLRNETSTRGEKDVIEEECLVRPDMVAVEKPIGGFIPDVLIFYDGNELAIEIFVTHKVDNEKLDLIENAGISAIEINLSSIERNISEDELRIILESGDYTRWLFNKKHKELISHEEDLVRRFGGRTERYKIVYYKTIEDYVIENPPCKNNEMTTLDSYGNRTVVSSTMKCENCVFLKGFDIDRWVLLPATNDYLNCCLKPGNNSFHYQY